MAETEHVRHHGHLVHVARAFLVTVHLLQPDEVRAEPCRRICEVRRIGRPVLRRMPCRRLNVATRAGACGCSGMSRPYGSAVHRPRRRVDPMPIVTEELGR